MLRVEPIFITMPVVFALLLLLLFLISQFIRPFNILPFQHIIASSFLKEYVSFPLECIFFRAKIKDRVKGVFGAGERPPYPSSTKSSDRFWQINGNV